MWLSDQWKDYRLLDGCDGEKLEQWGSFVYVRPDPQIIWKNKLDKRAWREADAQYHRSASGGGAWEFRTKAAEQEQVIRWNDLKFRVRPMGFKHMGLFPEQAVNWAFMQDMIRERQGQPRVLNLFAYTGGATVACLTSGASVCHVDAAKGMVAYAKENVALNALSDGPVRYIVDDAVKFVQREIRRGKSYDAILMDPPSYGRGPGGEIWKIENELYDLVTLCMELLSDQPLFFMINSYTTGLAPTAVQNLLYTTLVRRFGGKVSADEIGLPFEGTELVLPCGCTARWESWWGR